MTELRSNEFPTERLTKLAVADRQLFQAIRLFLSNGDTVATHTLAAASLQVLADLGKRVGLSTPSKSLDQIRPEKRGLVAKALSSAENFFKHADRDPEEIHEFYPEATPFLISEACLLHAALGGTMSPICSAFLIWFALNYPDVLLDCPLKVRAIQLGTQDPSLRERQVAYRLLLKIEHDQI